MKTRKQLIDFEHKGNEKHHFKLRPALLSLCMLTFIGGYSQTGQVNLNLKNATVKELFREIEKQTSYRFSYRDIEINNKGGITISGQGKELKEVLTNELAKQELDYTVSGNKIIVSANKRETLSTKEKKITGKIIDTKGEPVIGATIMEKGTTNGTITDFDGNFTLNVSVNAIIDISYIGYQTQSIKAIPGKILAITLKENTELLDEVVVVGYGTMKKSDLTGSVATLKGKEFNNISSASVEGLLQGRVSGLQVMNSSTDNPQGNTTVRIRGISSINGSNAPLIVVDGVPLGDAGNLTSINPNIIESIEVLKDASATAIYGSRGANGIIMISTKTGQGTKPNIWLSSKVTIGTFSEKLDYWKDPLKMAQLINEQYVNSGFTPLYSGQKDSQGIYRPSIKEISDGDWPYYTDWTDYVFRTSITQDHSIGIQGSNENSSYYASINYYKGEGMQIKDDYDKLTIDLSYKNKINSFFDFQVKTGFFTDKRNINDGMSYERNPLWPVYNGDGTYYRENNVDYYNPVMMTNERKNIYNGISGYLNTQINWKILPELSLSFSANFKGSQGKNSKFNPPTYTSDGDIYNGVGTVKKQTSINVLTDAYLTYSKRFNDIHNISAMVGINYELEKNDYLEGQGRGFTNTTLKDDYLQGADESLIWNGRNKIVLASGFTRINYTLKDRYLFTFTARADGSSKFGNNRKWGYFPSGAISWKISEEEFMRNQDIFDLLKVRMSYGISGNQGINPYQTFERFGMAYYWVDGKEYIVNGIGKEADQRDNPRYKTIDGMANSQLGWEKTSQLNFGFDSSFLKGRIDLTFDYYIKRTTDLLRLRLLPPSSGYDKVWVNDGTISNHGFEIALNTRLIENKKWNLKTGIIFNLNRNKVVEVGTIANSGLNVDKNGIKYQFIGSPVFDTENLNVIAVGYPMYSFYGYKVNGILQDYPYPDEPSTLMTSPGELNYEGLLSDGTMDPSYRTIIGDPNPDFTSSLNIDFTHKIGIDCSILLYGVYGNDVFTTKKISRPSLFDKRWTPERQSLNFPRLRANRSYHVSDWFVEDGSYLRVKNIVIGYTLPEQKIRFIKNLRLFANISNPLTLTKTLEFNPDVPENGIGNSSYPTITTYTVGFDVKF